MQPIRTVIVGYGYAGARIHAPLIRLAPGLALHGVCSSDAAKRQAIQRDLGCKAYPAYHDALADPDVQLVVLATPNSLHAEQAVAAMRAGKHVVVDKPMCLGTGQLTSMLETSHATRRILTVFHNRRFDGDFITLKELVATGRLGELRRLELAWQRAGLPRTWKQHAAEGGGRLMDLGSHLVDQALQLIPSRVTGVYCRMQWDFPGVDVESHAMLTIEFADGRTAVVDTSSDSYAPKPRYVAVGSQGTFVKDGVDPQEAALLAGDIDAAVESESQYGRLHTPGGVTTVPTRPGRWRTYYEDLAAVLRKADDPYPLRGELPVPAEEAGRVVAVLEAAIRSADTARHVALDV